MDLQQPARGWPGVRRSTRAGRASSRRRSQELPSWHRELPLHPNPLVEGLDDWYNEFLAHPDDGPFWWRWNIGHRHGDIETPIVHMGGWFDIFLAGTIKNFVGHAGQGAHPGGAGRPAAGRRPVDPRPVEHGEDRPGRGRLRVRGDPRLQRHPRCPGSTTGCAGAKNAVPDEPRVQLFVMGENRWRDRRHLPVARHPRDAVVPPRRRAPGAGGAGGRGAGGRLPLRSGRPGPDARRRRRSTSRAAPTTSGPSRGAASPTRAHRSSATSP